MEPISTILEKKVVDSLLYFFRGLFTRHRDQKREIEALKERNAALEAQVNQRAGSNRLIAGLICHPQDDNLYWGRDGSGPYCQFCLDEARLVPLPRAGEGSYYCVYHQYTFVTQARREWLRNYVPPARTWRQLKQRLEAESRQQAQRNR